LGPKARAARGPAEPGHFQNGSPYVETATTRAARINRGGPRCQVCIHPERIRIEALHVGGVSLDGLQAEFGLQRDAIHRHCKNHVTKMAKINYLAGPVQIATLAQAAARENKSILEYLVVIRSILMQQLVKSAEGGKALTAGQISGYLTTVLQTIGKITGEISALASTTLTINNNVQILNSQPFVDLQAGLLEVCQRHPDARGDIVDLFRRRDAKHAAPAAPDMKLIEAEPISRSEAIRAGQGAKREREAMGA
jgi:hypothetical protein